LKLAIAFGTRPEIIKISSIVRVCSLDPRIETVLISSGQHSELNTMTMNDLGLQADHNLNLMSNNQGLSQFGSRCLSAMHQLFDEIKVDGLIVQGDTSTALFSGLAAFNLGIPVFHVEAGLRSHDLSNPFPEEMNRACIARFATFNFAPTQNAFENLIKENIPPEKILVTGNTVVDALQELLKTSVLSTNYKTEIDKFQHNILLTMHRRENHEALGNFLEHFTSFANTHPDIGVWLPAHPNPNVQKQLAKVSKKSPNLKILGPLPYSEFISILSQMDLIVTDSGGVQEESIALGKRVIVVRETTERPEGLVTGLAKLFDIKSRNLAQELISSLNYIHDKQDFSKVYGDGHASIRIVEKILEISKFKK